MSAASSMNLKAAGVQFKPMKQGSQKRLLKWYPTFNGEEKPRAKPIISELKFTT